MVYRQGAGFALPREARLPAVLSGLLDMSSNALFVMAMWHGQLTTVGLLTSLYPVSTVLLARMALRERIRPTQHVGVLLAFSCVLLVALA